ncbi:MAG: 2,3-bisphosphoglycerate-dependent phosphoglycerate mutase [Micromonosporaceae bacterium]|nr:2,3-bisphosphoglycerate-dependent phosphoglycerate mutase [Micromonosporaceae bacterium]
MAVEIVYETHATTTDNEAGIATGWLPGELSAAGRDQARELGRRRRGETPTAVFVSDLARAVQTAEIAFGGSGVPVHLDPRLRECNYGRLNGAPVTTVAAERRHRIDIPFPAGESYRQVVDRTAEFLADLAAGRDGSRIVLISHSANRWALDHLLNGADLAELVDAPFDWQEGWRYVLG